MTNTGFRYVNCEERKFVKVGDRLGYNGEHYDVIEKDNDFYLKNVTANEVKSMSSAIDPFIGFIFIK